MSNMITSKWIRSNIYKTTRNIYYRSLTVSSKQEPEEVKKNKVTDTKTRLKPMEEIPGPLSLPLIGNLLAFLPGGQFYNIERREFFNRLHQIYGPIVKLDHVFTPPTVILLYDADEAGKVLRGENLIPQRPTLRSVEMYKTKYSENRLKALVVSQGMEWKNFRSKINHIMLDPKSIAASHTKPLNEVAMDVVKRLRSQRNENFMIHDIDKDLKLWALEATFVVTLGYRLHELEPKLHENSREKRLIALLHKLFDTVEKTELSVNIWQYLYHGYFRTVAKTLSEIDRLILYYIHMAMENYNTQIINTAEEKSMLEKFLEIDEITALSAATESIMSGVDSMSNAASVLLYFLGSNPDKQTILREEISSGTSRVYLRACLKESLRIISPALANSRITTKYYNILGYDISPGVPVVFMHQSMSLMKSNFPQPEEYIPERWLVDKDHPLYHGNASPFATLSFGYGARTCIGQRIAELSLETLIARMVEHFDISWVGPPPVLAMRTTTYMKPPLTFILKDK